MIALAFAPLSSFADTASSADGPIPDSTSTASTDSSPSSTGDAGTTTVPIVVSPQPPEAPGATSTPPAPSDAASSTPLTTDNSTASTTPEAATTTDPVASPTDGASSAATDAASGGGSGGGTILVNGPVIPLNSTDVIYSYPIGGMPDASLSASTTDEDPPFVAVPPVRIAWTTGAPGTSVVIFSTSTAPVDYTSRYAPKVSDGALVTSHSISIPGLAADTPYSIIYQSRDASGNLIYSSSMDLNIHEASTTAAATSTVPDLSAAPSSDVGTTTFFENSQVSP